MAVIIILTTIIIIPDLGVPSAPKVADDGRFLAGPLVVAPSSKKEERPIRRPAAELLQALEGDKPPQPWGLSSLQAASAGGADLAVEIPLSRWDHSEYFDPEGSKNLGIYARHGAFTELPGPVDPVYFKLEKEKAAELDPTQRPEPQCPSHRSGGGPPYSWTRAAPPPSWPQTWRPQLWDVAGRRWRWRWACGL
eukprot:s1378_g7.t1